MSVGVTLTAAQDVVFNDLSWVPADNMQARKRIHRIGQSKKCRCHHMISGPTDAYIKAVLEEKEKTINQVLEDTK
jgi:SNF2 family DNA or RNA helicase